jgi:hypothetical protein
MLCLCYFRHSFSAISHTQVRHPAIPTITQSGVYRNVIIENTYRWLETGTGEATFHQMEENVLADTSEVEIAGQKKWILLRQLGGTAKRSMHKFRELHQQYHEEYRTCPRHLQLYIVQHERTL